MARKILAVKFIEMKETKSSRNIAAIFKAMLCFSVLSTFCVLTFITIGCSTYVTATDPVNKATHAVALLLRRSCYRHLELSLHLNIVGYVYIHIFRIV